MRISDWSSDVCSSDLPQTRSGRGRGGGRPVILVNGRRISGFGAVRNIPPEAIAKVEIFPEEVALQYGYSATERVVNFVLKPDLRQVRSEAHTSELPSLMRISYAVFCFKKKSTALATEQNLSKQRRC